jgi:hypothetical protein
MAPKSDLIAFFEGSGGDFRGRKFSDILKWSDVELEASHDYIQTLFPLPEASQVIWSAAIIDRKVFDAFHAQPELRGKLRAALTRMLSFYGFQWLEDASEKKVRKLARDMMGSLYQFIPIQANLDPFTRSFEETTTIQHLRTGFVGSTITTLESLESLDHCGFWALRRKR